MQRRLVENFTFTLEWGTHGAGHIPVVFPLHAAYSALRHFSNYETNLYEIHDHQICNLLKYGNLKKVQNILGEGGQIKYGLFPLFVTFFYMHASLSEAV